MSVAWAKWRQWAAPLGCCLKRPWSFEHENRSGLIFERMSHWTLVDELNVFLKSPFCNNLHSGMPLGQHSCQKQYFSSFTVLTVLCFFFLFFLPKRTATVGIKLVARTFCKSLFSYEVFFNMAHSLADYLAKTDLKFWYWVNEF